MTEKKKPVKDLMLRVRVSEHEMEKLRSYAARHDRAISTVIREYIRRIPNPENPEV